MVLEFHIVGTGVLLNWYWDIKWDYCNIYKMRIRQSNWERLMPYFNCLNNDDLILVIQSIGVYRERNSFRKKASPLRRIQNQRRTCWSIAPMALMLWYAIYWVWEVSAACFLWIFGGGSEITFITTSTNQCICLTLQANKKIEWQDTINHLSTIQNK